MIPLHKLKFLRGSNKFLVYIAELKIVHELCYTNINLIYTNNLRAHTHDILNELLTLLKSFNFQ